MARFLANENIPRAAIQSLRSRGHDVTWIAELAKGASDEAVATRAEKETRLLLTFDKDFADLIIRRRLAQPRGVILCRFRVQSPQAIAKLLSEVLSRSLPWEGHFAVVDESDVRLIPLP